MFVLRGLIAVLIMFSLAACSGKPIKTYDGAALDKGEEVMLIAGDNIEVISIDGKRMKKYLLSSIETPYALAPGKHHVVFNYTSVWARSKPGPEGERSELVESAPQVVEFEAQPGATLVFDFAEVNNVREARSFAENFSAFLRDDSGEAVAVSELYTGQYEQSVVNGGGAVNPTQGAAGSAGLSVSDQSLPALEGMKVLWERASAEDKKAFLKWAFK